MATTYLSRTSGTPTDSKKTTLSVWLKRSGLGTGTFFGGGADSNNHTFINFNPNGKIFLQSSSGGSNTLVFVTTQVFRDTSAWYHIVVAIDTTQGTASNRVKLYVNGVQVTVFDTETQPSQNLELEWNKSGKTLEIGKYLFQSTYSIYDGSMSHFNFIDGTQELPTVFGETDSTTGEWKIKTSPSVTYGINGCFILKDGNSVTDQSGNSNNFTVASGTLTNTEDCPSNVFATNNPLDFPQSNATFANGNLTWSTTTASQYFWTRSTLGASSGKYYFEAKLSSASSYNHIGITDTSPASATTSLEDGAYNWGYKNSDGYIYNNGSGSSYGSTFTTGDIISVALDLDNNKLYFRKNNDAWNNSGDPTSGATGTGAISITAPASTSTGNYFFCVSDNSSSNNVTWQSNFGNGYFGTTAVSSAGTNASSNGVFEYDVPTGYTALSTKGLNL